ncbi:class I SAM-dependent methyltransferase [Actinomadura sp. 7K507]|uniref:methyltransferase n=1 Tax=Actinomadura sp. 7K507 TaxID=2530365 RepID=UPI0010455FDE|nr:class I SAM-dependent methyltransferase [Actinomadura sp. 7K507]TDC86429.1 class I SAM-dependent methyltransferase [Actinomadura sp. 7K507]
MSTQNRHSSLERAADLAAVAALLQIGVELGVDQVLDSGAAFQVGDLTKHSGLPEPGLREYLRAMTAAGLVVEADAAGWYEVAEDYPERRYEAGYVSWAMNANHPFLHNARSFFADADAAERTHRRDGRRVAVSTRWMGERGFYPAIVERVSAAGALRVADLGAGAGALLVQLLLKDTARTGVALDISAAACAASREAAAEAGVGDRLEVVEGSIESLVDDPGPIKGAEVIQACFVMHDLLQDDAMSSSVLRSCREALAPNGFMAVADAVAYAAEPSERKFSALFTHLHANFMNVRLPEEEEWMAKFRAAGFSAVECIPLTLPGGRLFVATK